ncbi:MAG TPA: beta-galactosidase GalA [Puia sp.]|nr:beta-galactosidase GalA [Puia sp.]
MKVCSIIAALLMIAAQGHAQSGNSEHVMNLHTLAGARSLTMAAVEGSLRHRQSIDDGWKFHFGDAADPARDFNFSLVSIFAKSGKAAGTAIAPEFPDSGWRTLQLPHDWAVELPFENSPDADVMAHGYKPVGGLFPRTSIGWYRKHFALTAADSGRRWVVRFDGVFRDSKVWINGFYLGGNASGYSGFEFDVTDYIRFDKENVLAVRVDASQYEGWYYEGAGIYRHVWLDSYDNLHIAQDGVFVHSTVEKDAATVTVETTVQNNAPLAGDAELTCFVTDRDGRQVGEAVTAPLSVAANGEKTVRQDIVVPRPILWSTDAPYLYRAVAVVHVGGKIIDAEKLRIGVRTIRIDSSGLYVNGIYTKVKGVNAHQDHAGVGNALPDYLYYHRIRLLKEMGANAFRTSHNPPAPELLDACDSLGMLVLDENRLLNSSPEYLDQFRRLIYRDRSRASVFLWSIGNEEGHIQTGPLGRRIAQTLVQRQQEWDPTRLSTYGADLANEYKGVNEVVAVRGFNYRIFAVDPYHKDHPTQPILGTEMGSTVTTRGIYTKDSVAGYVPDEDLMAPWWANTAEQWWPLAADRPWWMGGFIWTGFDYRGEPTPYQWPNINSHFGVMDMCGFPKNLFYYYQSWWTDKDVLHISPHWNWKGREGKHISVWVNSNADRVTLFLNGKSLGEKIMPRNKHLEWNVPYAPGKLEAVGYRNGRKLTASVETTGSPYEVVVTPYRTTMLADGRDASVINISVVDKKGREVPDAGDLITFTVRGGMKILGVGNGDPSSHEPDKCEEGKWQRHLFNGKCQVIVSAGVNPDRVYFEASAQGLHPGSTDIYLVRPDKPVAGPGASASPGVAPDTSHARPISKMLGADISFLPEQEAKGIKFSDKGVQKDALQILKDHGFNYIRLRIFNEPARDSGYSPGKGFCDLAHTMQMARRIRAAGMMFLLDFHYSDYWADPGKQYKPEAWKSCDFPALQDSVYAFTVRVLQALKDQGTPPDMVQVGNEINHGMIWPEGSISHPDSLAALVRAGIRGVRAVDAECPVMLHIALGGQNDESHFFLDNMLRRGVHFDVVGLSYYPKWHGTLADLSYNVNDLARSYKKDIIIVEYTQLKREVNEIAFSIPDGLGKGTCIWEPLNTWERIFDEQGRSNELLGVYDEVSKKYLKAK